MKTGKRDADWNVAHGTIVLQLRLLRKDGGRVYKGIHDALLSDALPPSQQAAVIALLGDIATSEALKTLSDLLRDGYKPEDHPDLRNAMPRAVGNIAYRAYQEYRAAALTEEDRAAVSAQLEDLLRASREHPAVYATAAGGLAKIDTESGIDVLLQELASNKLYKERVRISREAGALLQAAMAEEFQNPQDQIGSSISRNCTL